MQVKTYECKYAFGYQEMFNAPFFYAFYFSLENVDGFFGRITTHINF